MLTDWVTTYQPVPSRAIYIYIGSWWITAFNTLPYYYSRNAKQFRVLGSLCKLTFDLMLLISLSPTHPTTKHTNNYRFNQWMTQKGAGLFYFNFHGYKIVCASFNCCQLFHSQQKGKTIHDFLVRFCYLMKVNLTLKGWCFRSKTMHSIFNQ